MKQQLGNYAAWLTTEIRNASANIDPEVLQLPGGSFIAAGLWLYARGALAFKHASHKHRHH